MVIKFGKKYTLDYWSDVPELYFVPSHVENNKVCGEFFDHRTSINRSDSWYVDQFNGNNLHNQFYLMSKTVKNTALARKMYPEGEVEGEWLVIYG